MTTRSIIKIPDLECNEHSFITYEKDICHICNNNTNCITFDNSNGENNPCAICQDCTIKIFYKYFKEEKQNTNGLN